MPLHSSIPGTANLVLPCRHYDTVLEEVHLAGLLVYPANPEVHLPVIILSQRIGVRHVGPG
jgi:hypothetical protein